MRILSRGSSLTLFGSFLCASSLAICFWNFTRFDLIAMFVLFSLGFPERHPEHSQQLTGFVVAVRARDKRHVHALGERHLVGVNLRKHHLLGQAHAVVAVAVEALRVDAAE